MVYALVDRPSRRNSSVISELASRDRPKREWPLLVQEEREAAFTDIATDTTCTDIEFEASVGLRAAVLDDRLLDALLERSRDSAGGCG